MKKRLLALICVIALLIPLTACSKNKGDTELDREKLAGDFLCAMLLVDEDELEDLAHPDLVRYYSNLDPYDAFDCVPYDVKVLQTKELNKLNTDDLMELEEEIEEETGENIKFDKAYKIAVQVELYAKTEDGDKESVKMTVMVFVGECDGDWYGIWTSSK